MMIASTALMAVRITFSLTLFIRHLRLVNAFDGLQMKASDTLILLCHFPRKKEEKTGKCILF